MKTTTRIPRLIGDGPARRLCLAALLAFCALCANAGQTQALVMHMKNGGEIVYYLDTEPEITFRGQQMIVAAADDADRRVIPVDDVKCWTIDLLDYSGRPETEAATAVRVSVYPGMARVESPNRCAVTVYTAEGRVAATAWGDTLDFHLPGGIYIIVVSDKAFKVSIR